MVTPLLLSVHDSVCKQAPRIPIAVPVSSLRASEQVGREPKALLYRRKLPTPAVLRPLP